jgi:hypothetical protein
MESGNNGQVISRQPSSLQGKLFNQSSGTGMLSARKIKKLPKHMSHKTLLKLFDYEFVERF